MAYSTYAAGGQVLLIGWQWRGSGSGIQDPRPRLVWVLPDEGEAKDASISTAGGLIETDEKRLELTLKDRLYSAVAITAEPSARRPATVMNNVTSGAGWRRLLVTRSWHWRRSRQLRRPVPRPRRHKADMYNRWVCESVIGGGHSHTHSGRCGKAVDFSGRKGHRWRRYCKGWWWCGW